MLNVYITVFLRELEYFKGIMILTTNRAESIDVAFGSCIDIRLRYPALNVTARRQVWVNSMAISEVLTVEEADLDKLAEVELNGKEIKSAMKMAYLLSSGKGEKIEIGHLWAVMKFTMALRGGNRSLYDSSSSPSLCGTALESLCL